MLGLGWVFFGWLEVEVGWVGWLGEEVPSISGCGTQVFVPLTTTSHWHERCTNDWSSCYKFVVSKNCINQTSQHCWFFMRFFLQSPQPYSKVEWQVTTHQGRTKSSNLPKARRSFRSNTYQKIQTCSPYRRRGWFSCFWLFLFWCVFQTYLPFIWSYIWCICSHFERFLQAIQQKSQRGTLFLP